MRTPSVSPGAGGTRALIPQALSALRLSGSVADLPVYPVLRSCVPPKRDTTSADFVVLTFGRAPRFLCLAFACAPDHPQVREPPRSPAQCWHHPWGTVVRAVARQIREGVFTPRAGSSRSMFH